MLIQSATYTLNLFTMFTVCVLPLRVLSTAYNCILLGLGFDEAEGNKGIEDTHPSQNLHST